MMLTIFTPTYNRVTLLPRLFDSLCKQNCTDFEWIIVDDGSTDSTRQWIEGLKEEAGFPIKYFYQQNSGKHVAINKGIELSYGEIFLCVDSDDYLASESVVSGAIRDWNNCKRNRNCAGLISQKGLTDFSLLGDDFPERLEYVSTSDLDRKYHVKGEKNVVFRTEYLKECLYPVFEGEKFCPDSYITDKLSQTYVMKLRDNIDVLCEYQSDGLSDRFKELMKNNPKGFCISNMQIIDMFDSMFERVMTAIRYWAFYYLAQPFEITYTGHHQMMVKLVRFPGYLYSKYYKFVL